MPKKLRRDKRGKPLLRSATALKSARIHSVKELLARTAPGMTRVTEQAERQQFWRSWLCRKLPAELALQVAAVSERGQVLTVFASSAAWSARLRYALAELEGEMRSEAPALVSVAVRVRPSA
jgi:hypothetical protein